MKKVYEIRRFDSVEFTVAELTEEEARAKSLEVGVQSVTEFREPSTNSAGHGDNTSQ